MSDWYKMYPLDWNDGTNDLTLEQEGAYLRICHAIYITGRPIPDNKFVVAGLIRCNDRKANRLLSELCDAGKIVIENGFISNRRAVEEVSNRDRLRTDRKSAGSRGGTESAKTRAKSLKNNEPPQASATQANQPDKIRLDKNTPIAPKGRERYADPALVLHAVVDGMTARRFTDHCAQKQKKLSAGTAEAIVAELQKFKNRGGNPVEAIDMAIKRGWTTIELDWLRNAKLSTRSGGDDQTDWLAWCLVFFQDGTWKDTLGPKPLEPGCSAPDDIIEQAKKQTQAA